MNLDNIQNKINVSKEDMVGIISQIKVLFESTAPETFCTFKPKKTKVKKRRPNSNHGLTLNAFVPVICITKLGNVYENFINYQ